MNAPTDLVLFIIKSVYHTTLCFDCDMTRLLKTRGMKTYVMPVICNHCDTRIKLLLRNHLYRILFVHSLPPSVIKTKALQFYLVSCYT